MRGDEPRPGLWRRRGRPAAGARRARRAPAAISSTAAGSTLVTGFSATAVAPAGDRVIARRRDGRRASRSSARSTASSSRPGSARTSTLTRELRLELDPWLESARALGPLIDPNLHSCGSVPPHGHRELSHPEPGFYTVGVKSYGRAPTFLLLTGYEQARSVAAAIAGDLEAADGTQLVPARDRRLHEPIRPHRRRRIAGVLRRARAG